MKHLQTIERRRNLRLEAITKARAEDRWQEDAQTDTLAQAALRGESIVRVEQKRGERRKPLLRVSAVQWLYGEGKLGGGQDADLRQRAADQYGDDYRSSEDVRVRSCLNDSVSGNDSPSMVFERARRRLVQARIIGLQSHQGMITVCDMVCGASIRPRQLAMGDERKGIRNEQTLLIALDLLVAHYGLTARAA